MSDAADSLFPLSSPFYSGLNFAGCVWILKSSGGGARNCFGGRQGRTAGKSNGDFECGGKVWTVTVPAETAQAEVKCTENPAKRRDCKCIFRLLLLAKVHFEWNEGNRAWMWWRESWGVCNMCAHIHLREKKGWQATKISFPLCWGMERRQNWGYWQNYSWEKMGVQSHKTKFAFSVEKHELKWSAASSFQIAFCKTLNCFLNISYALRDWMCVHTSFHPLSVLPQWAVLELCNPCTWDQDTNPSIPKITRSKLRRF